MLVIIETGHIDARFKHEVNINFTLEQAMIEQRDSRSTDLLLSLTWALDGMGGKRHAPVTLPPVKNPGTHTRPVRTVADNLPPQGFDPRIVQRIANHYTFCAIPAHSPRKARRYND